MAHHHRARRRPDARHPTGRRHRHHRRSVDAHDRVTQLRQYTAAGTPTGAYQTTSYGYDRLDRLTTATDPAGNDWTWSHDLRGRLVGTTDPDKGATTQRLRQRRSAADHHRRPQRHARPRLRQSGRVTSLWQDAVGTGTKRAEWLYDTVADGQLTSSTRFDAGNAYTTTITGYDDGYRPLGISTTLPAADGTLAGVYTTTYTYNVDGSPATQVLPAVGGLPAETITTDLRHQRIPDLRGRAGHLRGGHVLLQLRRAASAHPRDGCDAGAADQHPRRGHPPDHRHRGAHREPDHTRHLGRGAHRQLQPQPGRSVTAITDTVGACGGLQPVPSLRPAAAAHRGLDHHRHHLPSHTIDRVSRRARPVLDQLVPRRGRQPHRPDPPRPGRCRRHHHQLHLPAARHPAAAHTPDRRHHRPRRVDGQQLRLRQHRQHHQPHHRRRGPDPRLGPRGPPGQPHHRRANHQLPLRRGRQPTAAP